MPEDTMARIDGTLRIMAALEELGYESSVALADHPGARVRLLEGRVGGRNWLKLLIWTTPALLEHGEQFNIWAYVFDREPVVPYVPDPKRSFATVATGEELVGEAEKIVRLLRKDGEDGLLKAYGLAPRIPFTPVLRM